jgi:soluble lytic murein transglycosylase
MPTDKFFGFIAGVLVFCGAFIGSVQPARGDIYRYVDERGVIHFSNTPTGPEYVFFMKEEPVEEDINYILDLIQRYASRFNLEKELVCAVIKAESDYNPRAVSSKGAQGLMQLIPETARDLKVHDPFDVRENIRGGSQYLRMMLDKFSGDLDLALAAYNAGPGAVREYKGIPPYSETIRYIEKVKTYLEQYREESDSTL